MLKRLLPFFILMIASLAAHAQEEERVYEEIVTDTVETVTTDYDETYQEESEYHPFPVDTMEHVHLVNISRDSIQNWKLSAQYKDLRKLDSMLHALKNRQQPRVIRTRSSRGNFFNSQVVKVILWVLALGFVGFVVYKLVLNKGIFSRDEKSVEIESGQTEEEILLAQNFQQLIAASVSKGDFRLATRYHFLQTLDKLNQRGLIGFSIDKTNLKYYYELPVEKKESFLRLSRYYEYVWYGNVSADENLFIQVDQAFNDFNKTI